MKPTADKWYQQVGTEGDVVISTRVRLARNINGYPFPAGMTVDQKRELVQRVKQALETTGERFVHLDMQNMPRRDALSMVERHLISPEFAACEAGSALFLTEDESISIMVCEEDHLRIQAMGAGMQLDDLYARVDRLDTALDQSLHFAFDERLGYLTQCPTNLGTGMRTSLMLHLPALQERGGIPALANTVSKLGLTIRGSYGEGSKPEGALYQLSNQVTLGISEQAAIENLKGIAAQIIREERAVRDELAHDPAFEDRAWRSLGILRSARRLSCDEFMQLISTLRVGVTTGLIGEVTLETIGELITAAQPANIMTAQQADLEPAQRDTARAKLVRERLGA